MDEAAQAPPQDVETDGPATHTVTPNGVEIDYYTSPKRKYEVRAPIYMCDDCDGQCDGEGCPITPMSEWQEVPSVTTVLGCLDKPALPWWGMTVGIEGIRQLIELNQLTIGSDGSRLGLMEYDEHLLDTSELTQLLTRAKLTTNHVKDKAATRGTGVHAALEAWAAIGQIPDPDQFPWEEKGYVTGLRDFLIEAQAGGLVSERMEVTVASVEHGFAGRFDLLAEVGCDMRVVTKVFPKNPSKYTVVPGGTRGLIDLKTSKGIYESHFLQLEGYETGLVECGYGPTDWRAILHVMADGRYEFRRAKATPEQFNAIVGAYNALEQVRAAMKL